ncbi:MAG: MFS transporter [Clostridia bacterium]|nr:MFS transporter [Clostridia bacterium]
MTKSCFTAAMASIVFEGVMTKSQTGLIIAVFYIVYTPLQIVGGIAADRNDPEALIKIGLIGGGMANLILFFNQNYYLVLVVWTLNAVVQFSIWPSVFKIISSQLEPHERRNATYYISFNTAAGVILAYLVAALLPKWHYNFAVSAIALFLSALVLHIATKRIKSYMVPDRMVKSGNTEEKVLLNVSTGKLFLESGLYILLTVVFLRVIVLSCVKTLSATMLMESYEKVSPSIGNFINVAIVSVGVIATVFVKNVLYPKRIKSAPTGVAVMVAITLLFSIPLIFIGKVSLAVTILSLCIMMGTLTAAQLFTNYCSLRFEKFGKSGMVSGITNAVSSFAIVINSYGVTKTAEHFSWQTVAEIFVIMLAISLLLSLAALPFWKRFKQKYHANQAQITSPVN